MGRLFTFMQSYFEKISKNSPYSYFPSQRGNSPSAIFILTAAAAITPHTKSYEIAAMAVHSFVKCNFSCPSVSLRNALYQWCQLTSLNVTFVDVICALHRVALNQNRDTFFIWSVDICFIFLDQLNVIFMRPFAKQLFGVIEL